jgi:hypothetical protein
MFNMEFKQITKLVCVQYIYMETHEELNIGTWYDLANIVDLAGHEKYGFLSWQYI